MTIFGDNPFDDGLDSVECPTQPADLKLPEFPLNYSEDCKLICWGWCMPVPDGERRMIVKIVNFKPDHKCGVYNGEVHFYDYRTGDEWYKGELKFYYTRNYTYTSLSRYGKKEESTAFRFVVKGDIRRINDDMPEWECLILCTKKTEEVMSYGSIFVYGGLDLFFDVEHNEMKGFQFSLGHNDGWYTHHKECSKRPVDWNGYGDYIGHYCERGWLFVSPGENFVFDPGIKPPTGRFFEEALREVNKNCYTEDAIKYGSFDLKHIRCIHSYQGLEGTTECGVSFNSTEFCQGLVYSRKKFPWITFFSMGYWMNLYEKPQQSLHLVEGNILLSRKNEEYGKGLYFYGFATQNADEDLKLVDLASNRETIGAPEEAELLLYLYNAGMPRRNPKLRRLVAIDPRLSAKLIRDEMLVTKEKNICPFLEVVDKK